MSLEAGEIEQKYRIPVVAAAGSNVVAFGIGANATYNTGMPIRYVGVGEKVDDLLPFDAEKFIASLFEI